VASALYTERYDVRIVHLGQEPAEIANAEAAGVQSVPALVLSGEPFHINFGASLSDLKKS
jgi:hypothetical protein